MEKVFYTQTTGLELLKTEKFVYKVQEKGGIYTNNKLRVAKNG